MSLSTSRIVAPTLSALIVAGSACTEHTAPAYSTLIVLTSTTGISLDPDGYTLTLTRTGGATTRQLRPNGSVGLPRTAGTDRVELGDVSPNCEVTSAPPATVAVAGDQAIDSLRFTVACAHASGAITVHTDVAESLATGPFRVVADGTDSRLLGAHDTTTFSDLADGTHTVVLTARGALKLPQFCVLPPDSVRVRVSGGARVETTIPLAMGCCGLPFGCD